MDNIIFPPKLVFWIIKIRHFLKPFTLIIASVLVGWIINEYAYPGRNNSTPEKPIRVDGYKLIKPLLICDSKYQDDSASLLPIRQNIEKYINDNINSGHLSTASVYFRYLNSGEEFNVNETEQFFPASLQKLIVMMRFYKTAESEPSILTVKKPLELHEDDNIGTIFSPRETPTPGEQYSAEELIEYMIKYSDNNSFNALYSYLGKTRYEKIYKDLQLQYPELTSSDEDFITTYQLSLFLRMLYSATYLTNQNSEKALNLLTQTDYRRALVRDLPKNMTVAHKFGVSTIKGDDGKWYGELHDCGIVYKNDNPYILCVMTKSESKDITVVENAIAEISSIAYQHAR